MMDLWLFAAVWLVEKKGHFPHQKKPYVAQNANHNRPVKYANQQMFDE